MSISRRDFMKTVGAGAAAAGVAGYIGTPRAALAASTEQACYPGGAYTWFFNELQTCCPNEELAADEMRITFLGTSCIPRLSQQGVSVYVEVGPSHKVGNFWVPADYAMFDCGMDVLSNYIAAGIPYSRMDKIFLAHLHADHMSELTAIYCFGESYDRKSPQYVWEPTASGVPDPATGQIYDDGTRATMEHFREWVRWHILQPWRAWPLARGLRQKIFNCYAEVFNVPLVVTQPNHIRCNRDSRYKYAVYFDPAGAKEQQFDCRHICSSFRFYPRACCAMIVVVNL